MSRIGRALPNRTNIVITRDRKYKAEGIHVKHSLDDAVKFAKTQPGCEEIFVIGGAQIFQEAIAIADKLYLTVIHKQVEGDVYFPDYSMFKDEVSREDGEEGEFTYTFIDLKK